MAEALRPTPLIVTSLRDQQVSRTTPFVRPLFVVMIHFAATTNGIIFAPAMPQTIMPVPDVLLRPMRCIATRIRISRDLPEILDARVPFVVWIRFVVTRSGTAFAEISLQKLRPVRNVSQRISLLHPMVATTDTLVLQKPTPISSTRILPSAQLLSLVNLDNGEPEVAVAGRL